VSRFFGTDHFLFLFVQVFFLPRWRSLPPTGRFFPSWIRPNGLESSDVAGDRKPLSGRLAPLGYLFPSQRNVPSPSMSLLVTPRLRLLVEESRIILAAQSFFLPGDHRLFRSFNQRPRSLVLLGKCTILSELTNLATSCKFPFRSTLYLIDDSNLQASELVVVIFLGPREVGSKTCSLFLL